MACVIGIDVGTSGTKTILMDGEGRILASDTAEYPLHAPHPGWSEQDPQDWWRAVCSTIRSVLAKAETAPEEVKGVSYSGQMHGSVFLDEAGEVVRPCLLWNDTRTWKECAEITEKATPAKLSEWISNPVMTGFTAPKALWLKNAEPENFAKTRTLLLPKDYIRYRMTGERVTEVTDAAGTALFNVKERRWATELLDVIGIPASWMPEVQASYEVTGHVTESAAVECGLAPGTPVIGGGADNPCGAVGCGAVEPGRVMVSLGTSGVIFCPSEAGQVDPSERLHNFCAAPPDQNYMMGVVISCGMCLSWYRDRFAAPERARAEREGRDVYDILMEQAAEVAPGAEGLFFLPYIMGERTPINDPHARGAWIGLSYRHGPAHLVRSLVEGVSFALRHNMEVVRELGVPVEEVRLIGGGAKSPFWRQLMADILDCEVATLRGDEGPAQGAAILAGLGAGLFTDLKSASDQLAPVATRVKPDPKTRDAYHPLFEAYKGLYPALQNHFSQAKKANV